jgi:hypothetical protein
VSTITQEAIQALAEKAGISLEHAEHVLRNEASGGRPQTNPWPLGEKVNKSEVALAVDLLERQGIPRAEALETVIATGDLSPIAQQIAAERERQQAIADEKAKQDWLTYDPNGIKYQVAEFEAAKAERETNLAIADKRAEMLGIPVDHLTEEERLELLQPPDPAMADTVENNLRYLAELDAREGGEQS